MSRKVQHALASATALATFALMTWGVDRPALWLDEAASMLATQRGWAGLWVLLGSSEAPLVPYYALLKLTTSAIEFVAPGAVPIEVLVRWPSVMGTVVAVWAMTLWLARCHSAGLAISSAALLLTTSSLSRYAQEARPYALVLTAAVIATILWTRLARDARRRWVPLYALALASLVAAHLLAGALLVAHLFAAIVTSERGMRRSVVLRTAAGAALALVVVSPLAVAAALNGQGPSLPGSLPAYVPAALVDTLTVGGVLVLTLVVGATLALCVVRSAGPRYRFIAWLATAWAVMPLVVLFPVMLVRPNLLIGRYLLFVLPGWAILGGLALVSIMDAVGRALERPIDRAEPQAASRRPLATVAASIVGVCALSAVAVSQIDALRAMRTADGHGDDIRPALAASTREEYAQLPIVVSPPKNSVQFGAYARHEEHRLVGIHVQRDQASIWSELDPYPVRKEQLRQAGRVILILRVSDAEGCLSSTRPPLTVLKRCLPRPLDRGYRVESTETDGRGWIFAVLTRRS